MKDGGVFLPYRERMTLRDLILQAGGFREGAYVGQAEVSRIVEEPPTGRSTTRVFTVPLDSTYVVTRERAVEPAGFDGMDGAAKAREVLYGAGAAGALALREIRQDLELGMVLLGSWTTTRRSTGEPWKGFPSWATVASSLRLPGAAAPRK